MTINSEGISLRAGYNYALAFANANQRLVEDAGFLIMVREPVLEDARA